MSRFPDAKEIVQRAALWSQEPSSRKALWEDIREAITDRDEILAARTACTILLAEEHPLIWLAWLHAYMATLSEVGEQHLHSAEEVISELDQMVIATGVGGGKDLALLKHLVDIMRTRHDQDHEDALNQSVFCPNHVKPNYRRSSGYSSPTKASSSKVKAKPPTPATLPRQPSSAGIKSKTRSQSASSILSPASSGKTIRRRSVAFNEIVEVATSLAPDARFPRRTSSVRRTRSWSPLKDERQDNEEGEAAQILDFRGAPHLPRPAQQAGAVNHSPCKFSIQESTPRLRTVVNDQAAVAALVPASTSSSTTHTTASTPANVAGVPQPVKEAVSIQTRCAT
jgi:hypothetical protein